MEWNNHPFEKDTPVRTFGSRSELAAWDAENLYLLDGNPVYHVNHLLGVFSAFNPDAIKNTRFY